MVIRRSRRCPSLLGALPLPRLELRWWQLDEPEHWRCDYVLVLPCADGRDEQGHGWIRVPMGTTMRESVKAPINEEGAVEMPFRDGVHCRRDAYILGIPAYAIYGEMRTRLDVIMWEQAAHL